MLSPRAMLVYKPLLAMTIVLALLGDTRLCETWLSCWNVVTGGPTCIAMLSLRALTSVGTRLTLFVLEVAPHHHWVLVLVSLVWCHLGLAWTSWTS